MTAYWEENIFLFHHCMVIVNKNLAFNFISFISLLGYGCAGVSSVAYGLIARECERFVINLYSSLFLLTA